METHLALRLAVVDGVREQPQAAEAQQHAHVRRQARDGLERRHEQQRRQPRAEH
jgi:hypothetical protein